MSKSKVNFVGAGPGAPELITMQGHRLLIEADLVIYAGSLVNPEIMSCCKESCKKIDSSKLSLDEVVSLIEEAVSLEKQVVRLHTGDPALYGAIGEQMNHLDEKSISYEITPGITSVFAAAAALKKELTLPGVSQSLVLTRTAGRTPMPDDETVSRFAKTGATLAFYLSMGNMEKLMLELKDAGRSGDTSVAVVYRVGWPNQKIVQGSIDTIVALVKDAGITRQAVILVGDVLSKTGDESLLYSSHFSHGYRNNLQSEQFHGAVALYCCSREGVLKGLEIASALENVTLYVPERFKELAPEATVYNSGGLKELIALQWSHFKGHVFMTATGIAVRMIGPLLESKEIDPAVVVCGEQAKQVISLAGGHLGGANRLTRKISRITGGEAVITTATDGEGLLAIDEIAALENWDIENPSVIKRFNAALLDKKSIDLLIPKDIYLKYHETCSLFRWIAIRGEQNSAYLAVLDPSQDELKTLPEDTIILRSKSFTLGVGCKKGVTSEVLLDSLQKVCGDKNISLGSISSIATVSLKKEEAGILQLAEKLGCSIEYHKSETLNTVSVINPSEKVFDKVGTPSVSEAAALLSSGGHLIIPKVKCGDHTFALAENRKRKSGSVVVVGLGSGSVKHLTPEVDSAIKKATTIAGYTKYVDFIRHRISAKRLIESGMRGEIDRCRKSLDAALQGEQVCMVCSGDAGILAMAGLLYEIQMNHDNYSEIDIHVKPGITAANIAAAALGAPLQNGFSLISLSDLLVPSEEVERNLRASAKSNLTCVLYNPAGKKRRALLEKSLQIFKEVRGNKTLSAIVFHAGRAGEEKWIGNLSDLPHEEVNMSSLVVIGSDRMIYNKGILFEERGYGDKYGA